MTPASGGAYSLTIDYAELLSGDAAERAAREDGQTSNDGNYIENRTKTLRMLVVHAWAQVYLLQGGQSTLVKPAVLYRLLQGEASSFSAFDGFPFLCADEDAKCLTVRIIQRSGQVLRIEQEYLP